MRIYGLEILPNKNRTHVLVFFRLFFFNGCSMRLGLPVSMILLSQVSVCAQIWIVNTLQDIANLQAAS